MSSSRSSSSEPEPQVAQKKTKKPQRKSQKHGRNEGDNQEASYQPPAGFVPMKHGSESEFDWAAVKDDDSLELWVVRVPEGLKAKHLENIKIEGPRSTKTARLGSIDRKNATYDIWSLGEDGAGVVGGDELRALSCLLPRHSEGGELYQAPKPIARRLVIASRPALPTPPQSPDSPPIVHQNPPRPRYPPELLKHRFMPMGSLAPADDSEVMDVDEVPAPETPSAKMPSKSRRKERLEAAEGSKKRRKDEAGTPKKTKKGAYTHVLCYSRAWRRGVAYETSGGTCVCHMSTVA